MWQNLISLHFHKLEIGAENGFGDLHLIEAQIWEILRKAGVLALCRTMGDHHFLFWASLLGLICALKQGLYNWLMVLVFLHCFKSH